jgi:hypothetical protein
MGRSMGRLARKGRNAQASQALNRSETHCKTSRSPRPGVADGIEQHKVTGNKPGGPGGSWPTGLR